MELAPKQQSQQNKEKQLLHDIKIFVKSFVDNGEISPLKLMSQISKKKDTLDDLMMRLEKY